MTRRALPSSALALCLALAQVLSSIAPVFAIEASKKALVGSVPAVSASAKISPDLAKRIHLLSLKLGGVSAANQAKAAALAPLRFRDAAPGPQTEPVESAATQLQRLGTGVAEAGSVETELGRAFSGRKASSTAGWVLGKFGRPAAFFRSLLAKAGFASASRGSVQKSGPFWAEKGTYPPTPGNTVTHLIDGEESYAAVAQAIRKAGKYIYATVSYGDLDFVPDPADGRNLYQLLAQKAKDGTDVRLVIWNPGTALPDTIPDRGQESFPGVNGGPGTIQARWDTAPGDELYPALIGCHHQKNYMMDGPDGPVAFVGGINPVQSYWDSQRHNPADARRVPKRMNMAEGKTLPPLHDHFWRLQGPIVRHVTHNMIQRYNKANLPHKDVTRDLTMPQEIKEIQPSAGGIEAQFVRTIGRYAYPGFKGDTGIREIYLAAINGAAEFIYIENQYFYDHGVVAALKAAADRGVKLVALLTSRPDEHTPQGTLERLAEIVEKDKLALLGHGNALLLTLGVASPADPSNPAAKRLFQEIYIHAKLMIVDGRFVTGGSANIAPMSMHFHSESNVAHNDPDESLASLVRTCAEHLEMTLEDATAVLEQGGFPALFDLFKKHGGLNAQAKKDGAKPVSRVHPFGTTF